MNEKIKEFVEAMFAGLPKTQVVVEAKLGIIENMQEKFMELRCEGKSENEAFGTVVAQFGSMDELRRELGVDCFAPQSGYEEEEAPEAEGLHMEYKRFSKLYSVFAAISVGLYILSPIVFILLEPISGLAATIGFLLFAAIPTSIFVLFGIKEDYYKEQLGIDKRSRRKGGQSERADKEDDPFIGAIYIVATIVFLLLGFIGSWWHPGWLVFLLATAIVMLRESSRARKWG